MFIIKYLAVYKVQVYAGAIRVNVLQEWSLIHAQYICKKGTTVVLPAKRHWRADSDPILAHIDADWMFT